MERTWYYQDQEGVAASVEAGGAARSGDDHGVRAAG